MHSISNWKTGFFRKTVTIHVHTIHMYKLACLYRSTALRHLPIQITSSYTLHRATTFSSFQVTITMHKRVAGKAFYWQWLKREKWIKWKRCAYQLPLFRPQRVTELQFISYSTLWLQHFEDCCRDVIILLVLEWKPHRKISHLPALLFTLFLFSFFSAVLM